MISKEKLFENLAKDFKKAVENYRKARREQEIEKPYFGWSDPESEEKYYDEIEKRRNSINTSKDYIKLTREEYWQDILKSKIQVIGAIGGFELMEEFSLYLREVDNNELLLENAFVYYADGICGWCR